jgi:hypothetical protein
MKIDFDMKAIDAIPWILMAFLSVYLGPYTKKNPMMDFIELFGQMKRLKKIFLIQ